MLPGNENVLLCAGSTTITFHDIRKAAGSDFRLCHCRYSATIIIPFFVLGNAASRKQALLYENTDSHSKSISAAYVSPDGSALVSISNDNSMKLWVGDFSRGSDVRCVESLWKNNQTGRWLSTLRHCFDPKYPKSFLVGSMDQPRRMETFDIGEIDGETSSPHCFLHSTSLVGNALKSVCSRNAIHPSLNIIAGGNSSGRVHLFR